MSIQYEHKIRRMSKVDLYNEPRRSPMDQHEYNIGGENGWRVVHVVARAAEVIFVMEREIPDPDLRAAVTE